MYSRSSSTRRIGEGIRTKRTKSGLTYLAAIVIVNNLVVGLGDLHQLPDLDRVPNPDLLTLRWGEFVQDYYLAVCRFAQR